MSFRTVYGHSHSENGWPMVDQGSCEWITVPGTQVRLQIQSGWPLIILRAFAADFHAFVEPLRDPDSACWTPTNTVGTSNHLSGTACFSGDTEILTIDGPRRIGDLAGTDVQVLTADAFTGGLGRWVTAPIRSFGLQNTRTVTLTRHGRRKMVRATDDHRWFVRRIMQINYSEKGKKRNAHRHRTEEVTTRGLRPGDTLCTARPRSQAVVCQPSPLGVAAGIVFGDGSANNSNRTRAGASVDLFGAKEELLRFFPEPRTRRYHYEGGTYLQVDNLPRHFKDLPPLGESTGYLLGWLAGMIATDGHITDGGSVSVKTAREDVAEFIRSICPRLGIGMHVTQRKRAIDQGAKAEGFDYIASLERVTLDAQLFVRSDQREAFGQIERGPSRWKVESVEDGLTEEVFCTTVDDTRSFCLDEFILTGNCDLNWNSHPFRVLNAGFDDAKIATIRELLDFYEETVWWGNDWDDPKDAMHFQCGYDTYEHPHTGEFIVRKIRADGYSTFRRGNEPVPEQLSRPDTYALAIIREGQRRNISPRGIQIALAAALVESGLKNYANSRVPESLALDHDAVGSDGYSVGVFQQQIVRGDGGRWWWGDAQTCMTPSLAAGLFYDRLDHLPYDSTTHSPGWYAQAVQRSAFPDRYDQRFADAVLVYDRLFDGGDELDAHQAAMLADIHNALFSPQKSASKYADPDGRLWRLVELLHNIDSMSHETLVEKQALLGNPAAIALVLREANKGDEWARTVYRSCPGVKGKQ